jgi:hypothetical protein
MIDLEPKIRSEAYNPRVSSVSSCIGVVIWDGLGQGRRQDENADID